MTKLVVLRLDGDLAQQGFQVSLEIGEDGHYPDSSITGQLPAVPPLLECINHWQQAYDALGANTRIITPRSVSFSDIVDPKDACKEAAQQLARIFQTWLAAAEFRPVDSYFRQMLSPSDDIRLLIRTGDRHLHHLPWHLWDILDQYPHASLAFSPPQFQRTAQWEKTQSGQSTQATQFTQATQATRSTQATQDSTVSGVDAHSLSEAPPLKILAILGHRANIDIEADRKLLNALPRATVTFLVEPQRQAITDQLWEQSWDILFFAGHSQTESTGSQQSASSAGSMSIGSMSAPMSAPTSPAHKGETIQGRIFLNETDSLTLDELKYGLRRAIAHGLQLALFNSCDGLGLAYELEALNIPQLVVMRQPVPDLVAQTFLRYFLQTFSSGTSVSFATRDARERLQSEEGAFPCASWLPTLFQQPTLPPFFWPAPALPSPSIPPEESPAPIPPPPPPPSPSLKIKQTMGAIALTTLLTTVGVIALRLAGLLQGVELWAFDRLVQLPPHEAPDPRLLIVEATDADLQQWGYPLSDQVLTQALKTIEAAQPAVIGLDIFRPVAQEPGHAEFVDYLKTSDRLIAVCQHSSASIQGFAPPPDLAPDQVGFNDVLPDPDDIIRRHLIIMHSPMRSDCTPTIALSTVLALEYLDAEGVEIGVTSDGHMQLNDVVLQPLNRGISVYQQADLSGHQLLLNYRSQRASSQSTAGKPLHGIAQTVTLTQILNGEVSDSVIRDRIVLIGITAPEPKDDFATPHQPKLRGLLLHAHMTSQLISAVLDNRPLLRFWPAWGDGVWIALWGVIGSGSVILIRTGVGFPGQSPYRTRWFITNGILIGILVGLCWIFLIAGIWVPLVPGAIALLSSGLIIEQRPQ